jgi:hypothetical protein
MVATPTAFSVRDQDMNRPHACTIRLDRLGVTDIDLDPQSGAA